MLNARRLLLHDLAVLVSLLLCLAEAKRGGSSSGFRGATIRGGGRISSAARSAASAYRGGGISLGGGGIGGGGRTAISRARISAAASSSSRGAAIVAAAPIFIGGHGLAAGAHQRVLAHPDKPIRVEDLNYYWQAPASPCETPTAPPPTGPSWARAIERTGARNKTTTRPDGDDVERDEAEADAEAEAEECDRRLCSRAVDEESDHLSAAVFPNGTRASVLFWTCRESLSCCEWECCDETVTSTTSETTPYAVLVFIFIAVPFIFCVGIVAYEASHALAASTIFSHAKNRARKTSVRLNQSLSSPLLCDNTKQPAHV